MKLISYLPFLESLGNNISTALIFKALKHGPPAQLVLIETNDIKNKKIVENAFLNVLDIKTISIEYDINQPVVEFIDRIKAIDDSVFVLNITNINKDVICKLNILREELFALKKRIILILSSDVIGGFSEHAPDLYSWRSGPYSLNQIIIKE